MLVSTINGILNSEVQFSHGSVSVFNVGIGIRYFCRYFFQVGSVFGIGISKYRDIGSVFRYFSWSTLRVSWVTDKLGYRCWFIVCSSMRRLSSVTCLSQTCKPGLAGGLLMLPLASATGRLMKNTA